MPALVNSSVGSSPGTTGLDATMVWPLTGKFQEGLADVCGFHANFPELGLDAQRVRAKPAIIGLALSLMPL